MGVLEWGLFPPSRQWCDHGIAPKVGMWGPQSSRQNSAVTSIILEVAPPLFSPFLPIFGLATN